MLLKLIIFTALMCASARSENDVHQQLSDLQKTVELQQRVISDLVLNVETLTKQVSVLQHEHDGENEDRGRRQVETAAFSAYLDHRETVHTGQVLKFNQLLYNLGDSYSTDTGTFTCPVTGTYLFSFQIEDWASQEIRAYLMVDGINQVDAIINPHGLSSQSGNVVVLGLTKGQVVWVQTDSGTIFGDNGFRGTTFSGAILLY